jgi:hypothetical protein
VGDSLWSITIRVTRASLGAAKTNATAAAAAAPAILRFTFVSLFDAKVAPSCNARRFQALSRRSSGKHVNPHH